MPTVEPSLPRAQMQDLGYQLNITIPQAKGMARWGTSAFLLFWLGGWALGEGFAIWALIGTFSGGRTDGGLPGFGAVFLLVWLAFWTFGGLAAGLKVIGLLFGRDEITATTDELTIHSRPIGRPKQYIAHEVKDLRVDDTTNSIKFDYGAKTVRFGSGLEEAELKQIAELLRARLQLDKKSGW